MTVFSLSFSLFFSRSLFVSRSVSRVAFPSLFPVRLGGHPTLLWADKPPLFIPFFIPWCRHPKPCFWSSFSLFLSLFTLYLVSYSLLIPHRKGVVGVTFGSMMLVGVGLLVGSAADLG